MLFSYPRKHRTLTRIRIQSSTAPKRVTDIPHIWSQFRKEFGFHRFVFSVVRFFGFWDFGFSGIWIILSFGFLGFWGVVCLVFEFLRSWDACIFGVGDFVFWVFSELWISGYCYFGDLANLGFWNFRVLIFGVWDFGMLRFLHSENSERLATCSFSVFGFWDFEGFEVLWFCGSCVFWILEFSRFLVFGVLGFRDVAFFRFWEFWEILDLQCFVFRVFEILRILRFCDFGFWGFCNFGFPRSL